MEQIGLRPVQVEEEAGTDSQIDFESLYRSKFEDLYAYVASLMGDRHAAEEVTAAAFERAFRRQHKYRPSKGTPAAWLFGIARNAALDELRRLKRKASLMVDPGTGFEEGPESAVETRWRVELVRRALGELDGRQRELLALKFSGGLSNKEIAAVLCVSETNAGSMLYRAMEKLREECRQDPRLKPGVHDGGFDEIA